MNFLISKLNLNQIDILGPVFDCEFKLKIMLISSKFNLWLIEFSVFEWEFKPCGPAVLISKKYRKVFHNNLHLYRIKTNKQKQIKTNKS